MNRETKTLKRVALMSIRRINHVSIHGGLDVTRRIVVALDNVRGESIFIELCFPMTRGLRPKQFLKHPHHFQAVFATSLLMVIESRIVDVEVHHLSKYSCIC